MTSTLAGLKQAHLKFVSCFVRKAKVVPSLHGLTKTSEMAVDINNVAWRRFWTPTIMSFKEPFQEQWKHVVTILHLYYHESSILIILPLNVVSKYFFQNFRTISRRWGGLRSSTCGSSKRNGVLEKLHDPKRKGTDSNWAQFQFVHQKMHIPRKRLLEWEVRISTSFPIRYHLSHY